MCHPLLKTYWPSERRAIVVHKFFLSIELQREATIEEAIKSWETGVCEPWRRDKLRRDCNAQIEEIEKHKYYMSQRLGQDVGWDTAAEDWVASHAAAWREWGEMQSGAGA
jgi:hypothetical protein